MHARRTKALRLRLRRLFGTGARWTASRVPRPLTAFRTFLRLGAFLLLGTISPIGSVAIGAFTVPTIPAGGPTLARPALAPIRPFGTAASDEGGRHELLVTARRPDDFDALRLVALLLLDRREADDGHAVEIEVGIGAKDRADRGAVRHERYVDDTSGLARAGSTPRPRSITAIARELDIDPARHGERR
jgi:hypothetical protein